MNPSDAHPHRTPSRVIATWARRTTCASAANATNATAATAFSAGTFVCVSGPFAAGGVRPTGGAVVLQNN